ncbi:sugar isomerase [Aureimonas sp. SA4125]|uniref:MurR/RpiR family transcriptional regulator n=1 Tax=Aureimonas sp. SA4125 TaxID=2826993 RepID=UPI001CC40E39|nr:MurR/RpiR family transcriptional regulator [Aureimonas sp. SA4125]BDA83469.1 sugar isomerase [Aureimonas sp. SA4125]
MTAPLPPALPEDYDELRALILSRHETLPKRLAQVARFAVENPDEIAFGTAASIAAAAEVQPSTLVRLAQSLGYQGFSELQAIFRHRLRAKTTSYDERLSQARADGPGTAPIARGMLRSAAQSVERAERDLDAARVGLAASLIAAGETIYVLGQRRSAAPATYLGYLFGRLKMRSVVVGGSFGTEDDILALAGPGDVAVSISFTPYAANTIAWTRTLAANGVPIVGISDSLFSPVASLSSAWLEVVEADFEGFRSLSATMALAASLAVASAAERFGRGDMPPG